MYSLGEKPVKASSSGKMLKVLEETTYISVWAIMPSSSFFIIFLGKNKIKDKKKIMISNNTNSTK